MVDQDQRSGDNKTPGGWPEPDSGLRLHESTRDPRGTHRIVYWSEGITDCYNAVIYAKI